MKKLIWAHKAQKEFNEVYDFWVQHNKSDLYSEKLLDETLRIIKLIAESPEMGLETKRNKLRRVIINRTFSMTYKVEKENIKIASFFDGRRMLKDNL